MRILDARQVVEIVLTQVDLEFAHISLRCRHAEQALRMQHRWIGAKVAGEEPEDKRCLCRVTDARELVKLAQLLAKDV